MNSSQDGTERMRGVDPHKPRLSYETRAGIGFAVFFGAAAYFLWTEHRVHLFGILPLILLLGFCIGAHFLMHGRHGRGPHGGGTDGDSQYREKTE